LLFVLLAGLAVPQQSVLVTPRRERLLEDTGAPGLDQALRKLKTTARLLQTTAHPDDEDGAMLAFQSRGKGADVMLMSLTRGDGGQNKTGSNLFDELGVLRTLELSESSRYYGVQLRFSRAADFGFSKSPDETFQKWGDHGVVLADMVRVIRQFRPDVVASAWSGTASDGHGHHQAAGILAPEAVQAAADPKRFPEQIKEGLLPWQVKKLYSRTRGEDYTVRFEAGTVDPDLGTSYAQFGIEGYSQQKSQNASFFPARPGPNYRPYKLVTSVLPTKPAAGDHEQDFFDGIDITLPGLAGRLGSEQSKVPFLVPALKEIDADVDRAIATRAPEPLLAGAEKLNQITPQVEQSALSAEAKRDLLLRLKTKSRQFEEATRLALDLDFRVFRNQPSQMVVPGDNVTLVAKLVNKGKHQIEVKQISLDLPAGWQQKAMSDSSKVVAPGESASVEVRVSVPANAEITRPYWHRNDPDKENIFTIDDPRYQTLPLPPPPIRAHLIYEAYGKPGTIHADGVAEMNGTAVALAVAPAFSVLMKHATEIVPLGKQGTIAEDVVVRHTLAVPAEATLHLEVPSGWRVHPASQEIIFGKADVEKIVHFDVEPAGVIEARTEIKAELESGGRKYDEGFSEVGRLDIATFYYYQPSIQKISVVKVAVPQNLKIGYVEGAGDDILASLEQLGLDVHLVTADELAHGDLSGYGTIILGIRAYDTREDVRSNNQRLLDFVKQGGTLVVQNNFDVDAFNNGKYTPFFAQLSRQRVSVEEAPVEILAPNDALMKFPNTITPHDFDGWIQERGVNFMSQWDDKFQPLLATADPGESPLKGGLLEAKLGKGTYIYTGYVFFRELPAGVPGAIRLYVNLLSAGHER
jgi:LmbE family N-acetylglucosaminyl deacetylase